jgi:hypothetical protein
MGHGLLAIAQPVLDSCIMHGQIQNKQSEAKCERRNDMSGGEYVPLRPECRGRIYIPKLGVAA